MGKVIAVANQKDGCGKTTTTVNLAAALVGMGKTVAIIDADPQGSCTASLGYIQPDDIKVTIANIMMDVINDEPVDIGEGLLKHEEGIMLIPANIELAGLEVALFNVMSRETVLRSIIDMMPYHQHGRANTLGQAVRSIKNHDKWQLKGRPGEKRKRDFILQVQ